MVVKQKWSFPARAGVDPTSQVPNGEFSPPSPNPRRVIRDNQPEEEGP